MFIVKHIHPSGSEDLYQTPSVRYSPGRSAVFVTDGYGDVDGVSGTPATLWIVEADHEIPLTGGTVFVMNEAGKTVARYNLVAPEYRDPEQPSFAEFSREKDGGLAAEAVDTLRNPAGQSRQPPNRHELSGQGAE